MAITIQPIKDNRNGQTPDNGAQMVDKINSNFKNVSEEIGEVDGDAVHLGDQSSQVNYETPKTSADMAIQAVKDDKGNVIRDNYSTNMATGIDEFPEFSDKGVYNAGDIVRKDGRIYEFKQAHSSKPWIGTDARETSLRGEVIKRGINSDSYSGYPIVELGHLYNSDNNGVGEYIAHPLWDAITLRVYKPKGKIEVYGANVHGYVFFDEPIIKDRTLLVNRSGIVPKGAKLCVINLRKEDNPDGYDNLRVLQYASGADRNKVSSLNENALQVFGDFYNMAVKFDDQDITPEPITGQWFDPDRGMLIVMLQIGCFRVCV